MALNGTFYGSTSNQYIRPRIVWSATQSISGNTSTVTATLSYTRTNTGYTTTGTWAGSITINGNKASVSSKRLTIVNGSYVTAISHKVVVPHNADGSKTITISATGRIANTTLTSTTISASVTLDTIPRATTPTLSASSVDMGGTVTITLSRAVSTFYHKITCDFAGTTDTLTSNAGASYVWTVPDWATRLPNAASGTATLTVTTYASDGTNLGAKTVTLTLNVPASTVPTVEGVSVSEAVTEIANQFSVYVAGKSKVAVAVTASGIKGSTIKGYSATLAGKTYTAQSWTSDTLTSAGTLALKVRVQDSRNRWSGDTTVELTVEDYAAPKIQAFSAFRCDENGVPDDGGNYGAVVYRYSVSPLGGGNTAAMTVGYKQATEEDYQTLFTSTALSADETVYPKDTPLSSDYPYDLRLTVTDFFGADATAYAALPAIDMVLDVSPDFSALGVGGPALIEDVMDVYYLLRPRAGFRPMKLPDDTDLDTLTVPNVYTGVDGEQAGYVHGPDVSGPFTLEVYAGGDGSVMQRYTTLHATQPQLYYRAFVDDAWGSWLCLYPLADSGWLRPDYADGFRDYSPTQYAQYRRLGHQVQLQGAAQPTAMVTGGTEEKLMFTLPEGFRPSVQIAAVMQGSGRAVWLISVQTNGQVLFTRYRDDTGYINATTSAWLPFNLTFFVD